MPFSPPAARKKIHTRTIECVGYHRDDGLWDIEAWMTDIKTYGFDNHDRGRIEAGEPLHGMGIRITCDDNLKILHAEAATDYGPFHQCGDIAPAYSKLVGLRIGKGFNEAVKQLFDGAAGCTHLRELLRPLATTAYQTIYPTREKKRLENASDKRPGILDTCYALRSDGPVVAREWPQFYQDPVAAKTETGAGDNPAVKKAGNQ
jgi:hypothetical protein